ncbi:MAG: hypothetical protein ACD_16C00166G0007 [uncultured bacterium]|nr:MAG: hypothetical protein ACD_16C00166G0007 [uncultured bacterium]OFW69844.1 MAG: hypothetical protein A2X70_01470 [Alphaproteobacteria bacterium GWC2_42_16]OFW74423.1 MAG: hypothetical protein A2Z80_01395 [Alphaproteobacteria bacterium GWA2_41_27]OFW84564.1 MAG: hypothetical protein A3E50_07675 [Alphaproteobacteria bacterium RIFCSPHIGHO2_12_FULL_42_100]OFW86634.1 MAG: hypothetical protein A2W06_05540 [Alphaproteobacteria bacterium RBG_16_42_14]OFW91147.1 MAG: hypothetical protein A2W46_073
MTLSRQTIEILLDLIEIKMSSLQVQDREDARELTKLRKCRQELLATYVQKGSSPLTNNLKASAPQERRLRRNYY